jgi:hypothetical protein
LLEDERPHRYDAVSDSAGRNDAGTYDFTLGSAATAAVRSVADAAGFDSAA